MSREFPPKRDLSLSAVVWTPLLLAFVLIFVKSMWGSLVILAPILFVGWIWTSLRYIITEKTLEIHCGPFKDSIILENIQSVSQSHSLLSSPSLSFDRLKIEYDRFGDYTLISPLAKKEFLLLLRERCPQMKLDDKLNSLVTDVSRN